MTHKIWNIAPIARRDTLHAKILIPPVVASMMLVCGVAGAEAATVRLDELGGACAPGVHPRLLNALVMHESQGNPLAIGVNGGFRLQRQPKDRLEAVATAKWLAANGYNFDGGLGQVNVKNLRRLGMSVEDLFDPCANLRGASQILSDCYGRASRVRAAGSAVLRAALSCYNTGDYARGERNGYVGKIAGQLGQPILKVPALGSTAAVRAVKPSGAAVAEARADEGVTGDRAVTAPGQSGAFAWAEGDAFSRAARRVAESIEDE